MAKRHKSALKAHRHSERRRQANQRNKSRLRTILKSVQSTIETGRADEARAKLSEVYSVLDKMIQKGILHKNTAARYKSRLTKRISALSAPAA